MRFVAFRVSIARVVLGAQFSKNRSVANAYTQYYVKCYVNCKTTVVRPRLNTSTRVGLETRACVTRANRLTNIIWDATISKAAKTADTPSPTWILPSPIPIRGDVSTTVGGGNGWVWRPRVFRFGAEIFRPKTRMAPAARHRSNTAGPVSHTRAASDDKSRVLAPRGYSSNNGGRFVVDNILQYSTHKHVIAVIAVMLTAENDGRCRAHNAEKRPVNRICLRQAAHGCAGNVMRQTTKIQTIVTPTVGDVRTARPTWFGLA